MVGTHRISRISAFALMAGALLLTTGPAHAAFIAGVAIAGSTPSVNGRGPENTINGEGLTGLQHGNDEGTMWQVSDGSSATAYVTYDLGVSQQVDAVRIWNYNISGQDHKKPASVDVEFSIDNVTFSGLQEFSLDIPSGTSSYEGVVYDLAGDPMARYVRLTVERGAEYSWANEKGLSEVRFVAVPEPVSLGVVAVGGLGLLRRRR